jgi:hypothetical protein
MASSSPFLCFGFSQIVGKGVESEKYLKSSELLKCKAILEVE